MLITMAASRWNMNCQWEKLSFLIKAFCIHLCHFWCLWSRLILTVYVLESCLCRAKEIELMWYLSSILSCSEEFTTSWIPSVITELIHVTLMAQRTGYNLHEHIFHCQLMQLPITCDTFAKKCCSSVAGSVSKREWVTWRNAIVSKRGFKFLCRWMQMKAFEVQQS